MAFWRTQAIAIFSTFLLFSPLFCAHIDLEAETYAKWLNIPLSLNKLEERISQEECEEEPFLTWVEQVAREGKVLQVWPVLEQELNRAFIHNPQLAVAVVETISYSLLFSLYQDAPFEEKLYLLKKLGQSSSWQITPILQAALNSTYWPLQEQAIFTGLLCPSPEWKESWSEKFQDQSVHPRVKMAILFAAFALKEPQAKQWLKSVQSSTTEMDFALTCVSQRSFLSVPTIEQLQGLLDDDSQVANLFVAACLRFYCMHDEKIIAMAKRVMSKDPTRCFSILAPVLLQTLGPRVNEHFMQEFDNLSQSPSWQVRYWIWMREGLSQDKKNLEEVFTWLNKARLDLGDQLSAALFSSCFTCLFAHLDPKLAAPKCIEFLSSYPLAQQNSVIFNLLKIQAFDQWLELDVVYHWSLKLISTFLKSSQIWGYREILGGELSIIDNYEGQGSSALENILELREDALAAFCKLKKQKGEVLGREEIVSSVKGLDPLAKMMVIDRLFARGCFKEDKQLFANLGLQAYEADLSTEQASGDFHQLFQHVIRGEYTALQKHLPLAWASLMTWQKRFLLEKMRGLWTWQQLPFLSGEFLQANLELRIELVFAMLDAAKQGPSSP